MPKNNPNYLARVKAVGPNIIKSCFLEVYYTDINSKICTAFVTAGFD